MAANVLLQPIVTEHRLDRWEQRTSGEHHTWHTVVCTCGWRTEGHPIQHRAEVALEIHIECQIAKEANDKNRSELASLAEELRVFVGECEQAWRDEDRIDTIARYSR